MKYIFLFARIMVGSYYIFNSLNHFFALNMMAMYAQSKGVPLAELAVFVSGILLLVAGVTIMTGIFPKIGVLSLTLFFIPVTIMMHNFWAVSDPQYRMIEMVNFLKNFALMFSSWMFVMIPEPWALSLGSKVSKH